jgi:dienelactone hydrolase
MHTEDVEYLVDGNRHVGRLAVDRDRDGARPGVLVCHEGPGLTDLARGVAARLAGLGYVAFALDYHGDGKPLPRDQMMPRLGALMGDPDRIRRRAQAGYDVLVAQPETDASRVAAIGYCFGGTMALEFARGGAPLRAVVGFHSGLSTQLPEDARNITGSVLVHIGADDPMITPQHRADFEAEMRAGGVDWRMCLYGGAEHSFTNPDAASAGMAGVAYHEPTDRRSWQAMVELFDEVFRPA